MDRIEWVASVRLIWKLGLCICDLWSSVGIVETFPHLIDTFIYCLTIALYI